MPSKLKLNALSIHSFVTQKERTLGGNIHTKAANCTTVNYKRCPLSYDLNVCESMEPIWCKG